MLLTLAHSLPVVIVGLAMLSSGVFVAQTASQSHLRVAAPAGARVTAAGLYITCYYLGGTAAGVVPGAFWAFGKWPACVAFIVAMQLVALTIAFTTVLIVAGVIARAVRWVATAHNTKSNARRRSPNDSESGADSTAPCTSPQGAMLSRSTGDA